jgi:hypothetical protein
MVLASSKLAQASLGRTRELEGPGLEDVQVVLGSASEKTAIIRMGGQGFPRSPYTSKHLNF